MNNERFQAALNYIGDDLIAEAADYRPKAAGSKPGFFVKYGKAFACAAAALAGVIGLKLWSDIKFGSASLDVKSDPYDSLSAIISEINQANGEDSSPGVRFSPVYGKGDPTLDEWKGFDHVIWNTDKGTNSSDLKGVEDADNVEPGSVKISDKLHKLADTDPYPYSTCAVRVSFEPCRDEKEMDAWKFKGMTIGQLKTKIKIAKLEYTARQIENKSDFEASELADEQKVKELTKLLDNACYDYYLVKMQQFYDTFKSKNLEIYPVEQGSIDDYSWFYCFIPKEMLNTFTCKPDEAFYFDLADR